MRTCLFIVLEVRAKLEKSVANRMCGW